jgi:hypothetical protein
MESSPPEFIVVSEACDDAAIACKLADRIIQEEGPEWLRDLMDNPNNVRHWSGFDLGTPFTSWVRLKSLARELDIMPTSRTHSGTLGGIEYAQARKAVDVAIKLQKDRPIKALVLVRDLDSQPERCQGFKNTQSEVEAMSLAVLLAMPDPEREAWVLNGFLCQSDDERERLKAEKEKLKFDPCIETHRLRGKPGTNRDIKRVLAVLTDGNPDRERDCWEQTPLPTLRQNGPHTGLAAYLDEVRNRLLPLLSSHQP